MKIILIQMNIKNYIAVKKENENFNKAGRAYENIRKDKSTKLSKNSSCGDIKSTFEITKTFYPIAEINSNDSHII